MTLADEVNRMIRTTLENSEFTSASDNMAGSVKNRLIQINQQDNPDLEAELEKTISGEDDDGTTSPSDIKMGRQVKLSKDKIKTFETGQVGEIQKMLPNQFGNIKEFAVNPSTFIIGTVFKKLAKGAGVIILVTLITEAVKLIIEELLKPGRLLDIRFKRDIGKEILAFRRREDKQKQAQGYARIIVTTMPRLRGGQDQVYDSFREIAAGRPVFPEGTFMVADEKNAIPLSSSKYGRTGRFGRR